ncbi:MAG: amidohydrolase family protein [Propionibacteriaceae bacterium]|jgi:imidazolonepropionase-like amidohydrolase|nr:amidohydrolase family protein [Propionibacteriaceae bacterium]
MTITASRAVDAPQAEPPARVLLADRLFSGASADQLEHAAVAIASGQVVWAGPRSELPAAYADWPRQDHGDATILPGLVETHAHLGSYSRAAQPDVPDPARHAVAWEVLSSVKIARQLASVGVTTAQSLGARDYVDVALREAVKAGLVDGPRIVAAGPPITLTGGHSWYAGAEADSKTELRRQVRLHHKAGTNAVKVMATGGFMSHSTAPWNAQFTVSQFRALIDDAHRLGLHVAAHAHGSEGIRRVAQAGVDYIAHASFVGPDGRTAFDPELADQLASAGVYVDHSAVPTYPPVAGEGFAARAYQLYQHGVRLVVGHDIGAVLPASAYTWGLRQLEQAGLPRAEVLIAATSRGAAAVGLAGVTGVVAPGYAADLIVAAGDPLADLTALDHLLEIVLAGRRFEPDPVARFDPQERLAAPVRAPLAPDDARAAHLERQRRRAAHPLPRG